MVILVKMVVMVMVEMFEKRPVIDGFGLIVTLIYYLLGRFINQYKFHGHIEPFKPNNHFNHDNH